MLFLFDLQEELKNVPVGEVAGGFMADFLLPWGDPAPDLIVREQDDVKYLSIENREMNDAGIDFVMPLISNMKIGDRITVTGRVGSDAPLTNWGVGMFVNGDMSSHLNQQVAPSGLFCLSHLMDTAEIGANLVIRTVQWGDSAPTMDIYVDSILITRASGNMLVKKDERGTVYSLADDKDIQTVRMDRPSFEGGSFLMRAGTPDVSVIEDEGERMLLIDGRVRDWDAMDIVFSSMELMQGNIYRIRVTGTLGAEAPDETQILFMGVPSYAIRSSKRVMPGEDFVIEHVLTQSELETWTSMRLTTNGISAQASFIIKTVEVLAEGVI